MNKTEYYELLSNYEDLEEYMKEQRIKVLEDDAYFIGMQDGVASLLRSVINHCAERDELIQVLRTAIYDAEEKYGFRI